MTAKLCPKGFSFIVCLTIVTLILIATFRQHTAGLHQDIVSIYWVELFVPPWLLVIGVSQTSLMVGGFRSKALLALWEEEADPLAVQCGRGQLSCCLIVDIQASGISVPLFLLMLLGWSLMWIDSIYESTMQWGSRSINLTIPERIMPGLIDVFRNGRSLISWKPYIPIVFLNPDRKMFLFLRGTADGLVMVYALDNTAFDWLRIVWVIRQTDQFA